MATVYEINKGINRSIEFKGIKAQYIIYLAAGMVGLLLLFAILYVSGINIYLCLGIVLPSGTGLFFGVQRYSKKYGEHGLLKKTAQKRLPPFVQSSSRQVFIRLSEHGNEENKTTGKRISNL